MAKTFTPRLEAPAGNNRYWLHTSKGGLNQCIMINRNTGSCLPNCVGYAWGRAYEAWGVRPKLSRGNAEDWWAFKDGYVRSKTPRVGAIMCWRKGKAGYGADGAGHVAFVEKVNADGSVVISQSNYSGTRFFTATVKKPYAYGVGLTFQGFILPPVALTTAKPVSGFSLSNLDYPTTIKKGRYFTIRGKITSKLPMTSVTIGIVKDGKWVYRYVAKTTAKTFDIHKADQALMFRKLKKGNYYYRIFTADQNGTHKVLDKPFAVK